MIELILTSFAVGTIWFWITVIVASIIIIACVENEHYPIPTILLLALCIIYWNSIAAISVPILIGSIVVFGIIGAVWSMIQMWRLAKRETSRIHHIYGGSLNERQMGELKSTLSLSRNQTQITGWIAFWPWDMFWTLTGNFFTIIFDTLSGVYQGIVNRQLAKFSVVSDPKPAEPRRSGPYPTLDPR